MDQKPPAVPRGGGGSWRAPWGEEQHHTKGVPSQQHYAPRESSVEKRALSPGFDISGSGGDDAPLTCRSASSSPSATLNCSLEELSARREDLEKKRKMVQNERLREQETQRREQVRLEEILSMCAEYERQVQREREEGKGTSDGPGRSAVVGTPWQQRVAMAATHHPTDGCENNIEDDPSSPLDSPSPDGSPSTPSPSSPLLCQTAMATPPVTLGNQLVHQNRIKTNGSLPRDKQRPLPSSTPTDIHCQRGNGGPVPPATEACKSLTPSPDAEFPFGFNFDASTQWHSGSHGTSSLPRHFGHSKGIRGEEVQHNATISKAVASPPTSPTHPQSPRTRIRTNAASKVSSVLPPGGVPKGGVACESEEVEGVEDSQHVTRAALMVLSLSHGRPIGGTLPRSMAAGSRGRDGRTPPPLSPNRVQNMAAEEQTKDLSLEGEELKRERGKLLVALAAIKRKMNDIERQQEEALRELEMEQALLEGELNAVLGKVSEEDSRVENLARDLALYERKAMEERECTLRRLSDCQRRVEEAQGMMQRLETDLLSNKDPDKVEFLREQLKYQQEALEAERKAYEDLEFQQLEREAWWEAGREEMSREALEVSSRARGRRQRLEQLQGAREEARGAAECEASRIQAQRDMLIGRLDQGRQRLKVVERRLSDLSQMGVSGASWDGSPEGSSDPDESPPLSSAETTSSSVAVNTLPRGQERLTMTALSTGHLELLNGMVHGCVQRKQSQDDLDRISRVTSGAPIDVSSGGSLGRRTIESLRTIERNRQIHLVQQGSQVIEEERRRVEELKRRAQDEVRAKWEEGRLRVHTACRSDNATAALKDVVPAAGAHCLPACNGGTAGATQEGIGDIRAVHSESLNSIGGSEDSSVTESSDAPVESTTSSEEAVTQGARGHVTEAHRGNRRASDAASKVSANVTAGGAPAQGVTVGRVDVLPNSEGGDRRKDSQQQLAPSESLGVEFSSRPISDASSEGEESSRGVRRRAASTGRLSSVQHLRPLTRYLPIRGQQLDLRAHMEWAGHQPDQCPHVNLSASACRGHLLKAPASLSASVVRRASSSSFGGSTRGGGTLLSGLRGGGWARRWFVFDRSARCFSYYTDSSEKKSRCIVDFEAIQDVYVDHLNSVKSPSPRLTFCVKTRERAFHLVAPSAEAMRIWVDVIFTGAEGYIGFEYVT
ncbi:pleckstrin homology-like domain family B member 1 [Hetaerina americana]|uniref:pleckstrin homology-like domain family B member 1 n=1 Tax=Hetaerina americana TaxID=62018 RepID=UPI003A7F2035